MRSKYTESFKLAHSQLYTSDDSSHQGTSYSDQHDEINIQENIDGSNKFIQLSGSSVEGSWTNNPGEIPHFVPASVEAAKSFLQTSMTSRLPPPKPTTQKTCHGCHRPLGDGYHQGSYTGKAKCILTHYELCKGGIQDDDSWRACPENYIFNPNIVTNTGFESTLRQSDFISPSIYRSTPAGSTTSLHENGRTNQVGAASIDTVIESSRQNIDPDTAARLQRQANGEGARNRVRDQEQHILPLNNNVRSSSGGHVQTRVLTPPPPYGVQRKPANDEIINDLPQHIKDQISAFRAKNQASQAANNPPENNFDIRQLRADPNLRTSVNSGIQIIRENIPSLSNGSGHRVQFRDQQIYQPSHEGQYEWVVDSDGNKHLVQRQGAPAQIPPQHSLRYQHGEGTSPMASTRANSQHYDEIGGRHANMSNFRTEFRCSPTSGQVWTVQVPVQPQTVHPSQVRQSYRLEYRCCPSTGRVWQESVPITPTSQLISNTHEWLVDPHTGQRYKVLVQTSPNNPQHNAARFNPMSSQFQQIPQNINSSVIDRDIYKVGSYHGSSNQGHHDPSMNQSVTGITRIDKSSKKGHRLVDLAKQCPARWSKQTTNSTISLPLYSWASVVELESAISGRSSPLRDGELLGKLRHLKNILEVCCLNSTSSDFMGYGWSIAKDYAFKVEDEVANGLANWDDMTAAVRTNTLVLSQMDCPRMNASKANKKESEKLICTTYNKCTTIGKCEYEVNNPTKSCQRKHECSWCRNNLNQGNKHQERECRKKKDNGD